MEKKRMLCWLVPLVLLLLLIPFVVPSALPAAGAEGLDLPGYAPVELANPDPTPIDLSVDVVPYAPHPEAFLENSTGYLDSTISVKIDERVIDGTKVLFTWVQIADASQLRTALWSPWPRHGSGAGDKFATRIRSVLAVSGDFCNNPDAQRREGTLYRNGVRLREADFGNYDALIIDMEGNFHCLYRPAQDALKAYEGNILHCIVFGPALVIDGEKQTFVGNDYASGAGVGIQKKTQRQAICQMDELSYLIVTTEGPEQSRNGGFTIPEFTDLVASCGVKQAYNLDGGSSVWLVLGGTRVNNPRGQKRPIGDLIYFATAEPDPEPTEVPQAEETP